MLERRREAMQEVVAELGGVRVDFFDARRISDWVERHPSIGLWLRQKVGAPQLQGWQPYAPWAHNETELEAPYHLDETSRISVPGVDENVSVLEGIRHLRGTLSRPQTSARLIGLSGVGKTRLAQALFDDRIDPDTVLADETVIYTDLGDSPSPVPDRVIEFLGRLDGVFRVIVDNCGPDTHSRLTRLLRRSARNVSLLTIEYDLTDDIPEGTQCFDMKGASQDVLETLLRERFEILTQVDARRLAELAEGNARIAFAIASTVDQNTTLGELRDVDLFRRLFEQRRGAGPVLTGTAEALSLVYSFHGEDLTDTGELSVLVLDRGLTPIEAARNVAQLQSRGLVQARGSWRALLPHALANRIARDGLAAYPAQHLYDHWIEPAPTRLSVSFCHRLGLLHDLPVACEVARLAYGEAGVLGRASGLDEDRQRQFEYLAPLDPSGALGAIERTLGAGDALDARVADLVADLTYDAELFDRSATALGSIALEQIDADNPASNSAIGSFEALFAYHFSGTMADGQTRSTFLRRIIFDPDLPRLSELGLRALDAGLEISHFSSSRTMRFGSHSRSWGWHAQTWDERDEFFCDYIDLAFDVLGDLPEHYEAARRIIEQRFRGHWRHAAHRTRLIERINEAIGNRAWPGLHISARETLEFDGEGMEADVRTSLEDLIERLAPDSLAGQIRVSVILRDAANYREHDGDYRAMEAALTARAEALGQEAARDTDTLTEVRSELLSTNETMRVEPFGYGVGMGLADIAEEFERCCELVTTTLSGNYTFAYFLGLGRAWHEKDPNAFNNFLDRLPTDPVLGPTLVAMQMVAGLDHAALRRFEVYLSQVDAQPHRFSRVLWVSRESEWTDAERLHLLRLIGAADGETSVHAALEALSLFAFKRDTGSEAFRNSVLVWMTQQDPSSFSQQHSSDRLKRVFNAFAVDGLTDDIFTAFADRVDPAHLDDAELGFRYNDTRPVILGLLFAHAPRRSLARFASAANLANSRLIRTIFSDSYSLRDVGVLGRVTAELLADWCDEDPNLRYPFAAEFHAFHNGSGPGQRPSGLSEQSILLTNRAPDPAVIIDAIVRRLEPTSWSGSRAAAIENRLSWLDELNPDERGDIEVAVERGRFLLRQSVERTRAWEAERQNREDLSFE